MGGDATGFVYRERRGGDVEITHHGRRATVVRGGAHVRFLAEITAGDPHQVMARWTGNYGRGQEHQAGRHPRNEP